MIRATLFLWLLLGRPLTAQQFAAGGETRLSAIPVARGEDVVVAPAVIARGLPRTIQVVEVPVPREFALSNSVSYVVDPDGISPLLSRRTGTISEGDKPGKVRSVLLTFSLPKRARAGLLPVARVRFLVPGMTPIEVPVQVAVEVNQSIEITIGEGLRGVRPGDRFTLSYRVMNLGNSPETVLVSAVVPPGWEVVGGGNVTLAMGVNAMEERALTVGVPLGSATGSASVRVIGSTQGRPVATAEAQVLVLDQNDSPAGAGPMLTTAAGIGSSPGQEKTLAFGALIDGEVSEDIRMIGRFTTVSTLNSPGGYALTRVGLYRIDPSLHLFARRWNLGVGMVGMQFTDLTGMAQSGQGASAAIIQPRWRVSAMASRPQTWGEAVEGEYVGGRAEFSAGRLTFAGTATHMSDMRGTPRQLDAVAFGAMVPGVFRGTLNAELAQRRYDTGSGLGWTTGFQRFTARDNVSVKFAHAPGGSRAYARATDEIVASASRMITERVSLHGSYWNSRDDAGVALSRLDNEGWNLGTQLQLTTGLSLDLSGRRSAFSADGIAGGFGTEETYGTVALTARSGAAYATGSGSLGNTSRTTTVLGGGSIVEGGNQALAFGSLGVGGARGTIELSGRYERNDPSSGRIPQQGELGVRADKIPLLIRGATRVYAGATLRRTWWAGFGPARTTATGDLFADLPGGFGVGVSAERNPFLVNSGNTSGWFYALRVERRTSLPRLSKAKTQGIVFADLNGNGQYDEKEPGFSGALVRRRMESVVTDKTGLFEFSGAESDALALDPLSLGRGWITGPVRKVNGKYEIAVIAVAAVEISLALSPEVVERLAPADLAPIIVLARHESGRMWVARKLGPDLATFEALPPGRYTVELDLADITEPLEPQTRAAFTVDDNAGPTQRIRLTLKPRPVTIKLLDKPEQKP